MSTQTPTISVMIAGGGTAGHLLPGISVADALVAQGMPKSAIAFAGGNRGVERKLVGETDFALTELAGRGIQRRVTVANLGAVFALIRGFGQGVRLVRRQRPKVVLVLGGYASLACGVGAVFCRRPIVLCEQNARAGAVNRLLRFFATRSVVSFPDTDLPRATLTGNPLRAEIVEAAHVRDQDPARAKRQARDALGLDQDRVVVVVTSGSLGSRTVNNAVVGIAQEWQARNDVAIRHVTGTRDFSEIFERTHALRTARNGLDYQVIAYEDRMASALSAADVAVSRSGGGVAELAALGVPAILVPLPIAPRDHQRYNAQHLVDRQAARLLDDNECDTEHLGALLRLIVDDQSLRSAMAKEMRAAAHLDAAQQVARIVREVAEGQGSRR